MGLFCKKQELLVVPQFWILLRNTQDSCTPFQLANLIAPCLFGFPASKSGTRQIMPDKILRNPLLWVGTKKWLQITGRSKRIGYGCETCHLCPPRQAGILKSHCILLVTDISVYCAAVIQEFFRFGGSWKDLCESWDQNQALCCPGVNCLFCFVSRSSYFYRASHLRLLGRVVLTPFIALHLLTLIQLIQVFLKGKIQQGNRAVSLFLCLIFVHEVMSD